MTTSPPSLPTPRLARFALPALAALLLACSSPSPASEAQPQPVEGEAAGDSAPTAGAVAIVELFTSQGCSSCPSADRLLSQLAADPKLSGKVIPLSFHVDYWNYIGWTDPYSSPRWSERQRLYAAAANSNRIYTPQLVINGEEEMVGSDAREVRAAIERALAKPAAGSVELRVERTAQGARVHLVAQHAAAVERDLEVWVALVESGLETEVGRGENARRTLKNDAVVRQFERAFSLGSAAGSRGEGAVELDLPAGSAGVRKLAVVAFLQDPRSRAILGGSSHSL